MTSRESAKAAALRFIDFVNKSPTPYHAVETARQTLCRAGYVELNEREPWEGTVQKNGRYFFTRNRTTIIAFAVGGKFVPGNGFSIIGGHTDSPNLRVKPVSNVNKHGYRSVGVETYGGGLWHTWFDRDLTVAGKVIVHNKTTDTYETRLVHVERPIMRIPNLAIHLNRSVNSEGFKLNTETHLIPVIATSIREQCEMPVAEPAAKKQKDDSGHATQSSKHQSVLMHVLNEALALTDDESVGDFDLSLADAVPATVGGAFEEFIYAPRLDNLMSCYCALAALTAESTEATLSDEPGVRMIALFDHEEIGSSSAVGAGSALLEWVLRRLSVSDDKCAFERAMAQSFMISSDMAHAVHPNYPEKHEENHRPAMHCGPVIKFNSNQRYATSAHTAALLRHIARTHAVPIQDFVVRNDMPCGSTIGPIMSANLGMRTVDVGNPQLSMHSIREMCGCDDVVHALSLYSHFFVDFPSVDQKFKE